MTDQNIDALNDVAKTLFDSKKGYELACEICDDNPQLRSRFEQYAQQRGQLINEFQSEVRRLGEEPVESGGTAGAVHRAMTQFSTMFRDDAKVALAAIDDGEEHLAEEIESKLKRDELTPQTRALLEKAHRSAREGERFADMMEDA